MKGRKEFWWMMYNLWMFTHLDGIIHYTSYMKSVVGTQRAAFRNPGKAKRALVFPYRTIRLHECGNPSPHAIGWPTSSHRESRWMPGYTQASLPSHHRSTNRVAIGIHDGYLNYKIFARKLDFAFLRLYLCSVSQTHHGRSSSFYKTILQTKQKRSTLRPYNINQKS